MPVKIVLPHANLHDDVLVAMSTGQALAVLRPGPKASIVHDTAKSYVGEPALILPTSGTTDTPKLAVITWSAMKARVDTAIAAFGAEALSVVGVPNSGAAMSGVHSPVLAAVLLGKKLVSMDRERGWNAVDDHGVTFLFTRELPEHWPGKTSGGTLRHVVLTGCSLEEARRKLIAHRTGAKVMTWYGSAEMGPVCCSDGGSVADGLVGKTLPGVEARIESGYVEVKTPGLASGYVNAPLPLTDDGWFKTGDLGHVSAAGLHITNVGRGKG
jgi:long-subunit acyl-CoA synthetase (AMP-forming)